MLIPLNSSFTFPINCYSVQRTKYLHVFNISQYQLSRHPPSSHFTPYKAKQQNKTNTRSPPFLFLLHNHHLRQHHHPSFPSPPPHFLSCSRNCSRSLAAPTSPPSDLISRLIHLISSSHISFLHHRKQLNNSSAKVNKGKQTCLLLLCSKTMCAAMESAKSSDSEADAGSNNHPTTLLSNASSYAHASLDSMISPSSRQRAYDATSSFASNQPILFVRILSHIHLKKYHPFSNVINSTVLHSLSGHLLVAPPSPIPRLCPLHFSSRPLCRLRLHALLDRHRVSFPDPYAVHHVISRCAVLGNLSWELRPR